MTLFDLAQILGADIKVSGAYSVESRTQHWLAHIDHIDILDGYIAISSCGRGAEPEVALEDLARQLSGQHIQYRNLARNHRQELRLPATLTAR